MSNIIIHVPHSSNYIPNEYLSDYIITKDEIAKESDIMRDHYTDNLVENLLDVTIIKFEYSRIFCDVERFNNSSEIMNSIGMGVLYTHSHDGKLIRNISNKDPIINLYNEHHNKLNDTTRDLLEINGDVLIIDLHSYYDDPLAYEINKQLSRPDICIGVDYYHLDKIRLNKLIYMIEECGFTWSINEPFIGCLIPSNYYHKDNRVFGFMIEINKKIFNDIKIVQELFKKIIKL